MELYIIRVLIHLIIILCIVFAVPKLPSYEEPRMYNYIHVFYFVLLYKIQILIYTIYLTIIPFHNKIIIQFLTIFGHLFSYQTT